jgi:hypothetical protein
MRDSFDDKKDEITPKNMIRLLYRFYKENLYPMDPIPSFRHVLMWAIQSGDFDVNYSFFFNKQVSFASAEAAWRLRVDPQQYGLNWDVVSAAMAVKDATSRGRWSFSLVFRLFLWSFVWSFVFCFGLLFGLSSFALVFCLVFRLLLWSFVWSFGLCSQPSGPFRCSVFRQVAIFDRALSELVVDICTSRIAFVLGGLGRGQLASTKYAAQRHRNCSAALAAFSAT